MWSQIAERVWANLRHWGERHAGWRRDEPGAALDGPGERCCGQPGGSARGRRVAGAVWRPGGGPGGQRRAVFDPAAVSALVAVPSAAGTTTTAMPTPLAVPSSPPPSVSANPLPAQAGTTASPDASNPTILSTPVPDGPAAPSVGVIRRGKGTSVEG